MSGCWSYSAAPSSPWGCSGNLLAGGACTKPREPIAGDSSACFFPLPAPQCWIRWALTSLCFSAERSWMAEPRFNNPYFWPPPPTMPSQVRPPPYPAAREARRGSCLQSWVRSGCRAARSQLDNLVLINKIKEQLMAEKIRPPHLPPTSVSSQQPLLVPPSPAESSQSIMSLPKLQQVPGLHPQAVPQPDVALHARPATSTVTGLGLASRATAVSTSESSTGTSTPSTPTSTSQSRLIASSPTLISGITSPPLLDSIKTIQGHSLLGAPKPERGRKKIKAENPSGPPVLVVPYPILASGETAKEGKTYRCKVCPLTFFTKSEMQIHSKSHTEAKPHKCPHCSKSFANASYLAQHLRIHLGVKPYHCSYCEKSFRQLSHLQQHTRIHTGDRPYKCPHPGCEKAFTQLSNLQSHQRQHNKDKPYKCPNCYRAYSDSASLQIHLSAHAIKHAKAYCCSMCGRAYTSETYLMKHMSKHTVVEHLVSQHSPQRTESPGIPVRISLI
ncbi:zinc finger protein 362 isoform X2 [Gopherus evgoodei]|uniref:zinc finger protein 362 isoform X2 n=2 Tax=Gopherus evgoodei TaxID=1825980 RepID=UPI0011CFCD3E|nr:zinc finger protein 362 isoform X2 [Gopherus evgoodei]